MNQQEIFDKVAVHLFEQGKQANKDDGTCAYRGEAGTMCAVGCLIPDAMYVPSMDDAEEWEDGVGTSVQMIWNNFPDLVEYLGEGNLGLLNALQNVHDAFSPWLSTENMRRELGYAAETYELNPATLLTLSFSENR
jgi:hypothetical protein